MVIYENGDEVRFKYEKDWFTGIVDIKTGNIIHLTSQTFTGNITNQSVFGLDTTNDYYVTKHNLELIRKNIPEYRGLTKRKRLFKCMKCFKEESKKRFTKNICKFCKTEKMMVEVDNI